MLRKTIVRFGLTYIVTIRLNVKIRFFILLIISVTPIHADSSIESQLALVSVPFSRPNSGPHEFLGTHIIAFMETRYSSLLVQPLILEGYLGYKPANRSLVKHVTWPRESHISIDATAIVITNNNQQTRWHLSERPVLHITFLGLRALLEGNLTSLREHFALGYTTSENTWQLLLRPRNKLISQHMESWRITGEESQIDSIQIIMTNGDRQHMQLSKSSPDK